jgi:hypothetical protein
MAQMPRGEPRTVPDPGGEAFDAMIREDRRRAQDAKSFPAFSPYGGIDAVRNAPRQSSTMMIGRQMYQAVDNGRAIKLVPIDPLYTPAERATQRDGVVRALFMANHSLGTMAYAAATMMGAPQKTRDAALLGGGLADEAAMGARSPRAVRLRQPTPRIKSPREPVKQGRPNEKGQASGFNASMTRSMLEGGTKTRQSVKPPGFVAGDARGHLRGRQLGGRGEDRPNLVTLTQNPTNSPLMSTFENAVTRRVRAGEAVEYMVKPLYREGALPPSAILLTATGPHHPPAARLIRNPAGHR